MKHFVFARIALLVVTLLSVENSTLGAAGGAAAAAARGGDELRLINAAQHGNLEEVKRLLAAGVDPNGQDDRGSTALMWAAIRNENLEIVRALLAAGLTPE